MRRVVVVAALVLVSCGGSPAAPSVTAPPPAILPMTLNSGAYTLTITLSRSGLPVCTGGFCTTLSACNGNPDTTPATFDVQVERVGDDATVAIRGGAQSLAMLLHTARVPATGTISGAARDARGVMMDATGTLSGTGSASPGVAASGNIDGQVNAGGGGCSNNGHTWSLSY